MKISKFICTTVIFLTATSIVHAGWLPGRTIDNMYMTPDGNTVFVTFDSVIGHPDCPGARIVGIPESTAGRFEEMYASLLRAQAAQTSVEVRDDFTDTTCNASGTIIRLPYLRFLSQ